MKFFFKYITVPLIFFTFLSSCRQSELYEKDTVIPGYKWQSDFKAAGTFQISDTGSSYNVYIVLRHTDAYEYNNIWLNIGRQSPGDSMRFDKTNLSLGSDAQGWEGTGMSDIWEVRKLWLRAVHFPKTGAYNFNIAQIMRDNPLEHVMSAGIRLEKTP